MDCGWGGKGSLYVFSCREANEEMLSRLAEWSFETWAPSVCTCVYVCLGGRWWGVGRGIGGGTGDRLL